MRFPLRLFLLLSLTIACTSGFAQTLARPGWQGSGWTVERWWESAVFYQIDPRTFEDSKGTGVGDLRGIVQRLDSLQSLGVDALILSPFPLANAAAHGTAAAGAASPFDPAYGTEDDLALLLQEASRRRIRVLVDLPFNSALSEDETADAARFWLSRGLAGLRLTNPDPQRGSLTAAQTAARLSLLDRLCASYPGQRVLFWDIPASADSGGAVATSRSHLRTARRKAVPRQTIPKQIGTPLVPAEAPGTASASAPQLTLDDRLLGLDRWSAEELAGLLKARPNARFPHATAVLASDADCRPRSFGRLSEGAPPLEIARQTAALLLLGQAVPELYAGQELGMQTASLGTVSLGTVSNAVSASNVPSPMQESGPPQSPAAAPAGPSTATASTATAIAATEEDDQDSLLNWYRRLILLRHTSLAARTGSLEVLASAHPGLVVWIRRPRPAMRRATGAIGAAPVVVLCNVSSRATSVSLAAELRARGIPLGAGMLRTLASSSPVPSLVPLSGIALPAYGVYVGELRQPGLESVPAPARHRSGRGSPGRSSSLE